MEFQFRNSSKGSGLDHTTMTKLLVLYIEKSFMLKQCFSVNNQNIYATEELF
jgi:hypothetical protein